VVFIVFAAVNKRIHSFIQYNVLLTFTFMILCWRNL